MRKPVRYIGTAELAAASGLSKPRIRQLVDSGELVPDVVVTRGSQEIYGWEPGTTVARRKDSGPGRGKGAG